MLQSHPLAPIVLLPEPFPHSVCYFFLGDHCRALIVALAAAPFANNGFCLLSGGNYSDVHSPEPLLHSVSFVSLGDYYRALIVAIAAASLAEDGFYLPLAEKKSNCKTGT